LPSRHYEQAADVLAEGLERLGSRVAATAVGDVARERGRALGLVARRNAGRRPGRRRRLTALIELLDEAGFEPEVDRSGTVRLRNCPYDALAVEHRDLTCGMNVAWGEGVVDALEPGLSAELAPSTGYCCVLFRQTEPGGRSNRARSRPACAAG
jgi:predicted ArsR family transcriptional regulator